MGVSIDIDVDMADAMRRLNGIQARSTDFSSVLRWAGDELEKSNAANFAQNGLPSGKSWSPLDPEYSRWKSRNFPGRPKMVRTGRLFKSLTNMKGVPSYVARTTAEFGTAVEYAKYHQTGTFKMPKRQIVFEPPLFAKRLGSKAADYMANGGL